MKKVNKYYLLIFSMIMFTSCSISTTRTDKVHLKEPIESISKLQNYEINANVWYDGKLQESFNPEGSSFSVDNRNCFSFILQTEGSLINIKFPNVEIEGDYFDLTFDCESNEVSVRYNQHDEEGLYGRIKGFLKSPGLEGSSKPHSLYVEFECHMELETEYEGKPLRVEILSLKRRFLPE